MHPPKSLLLMINSRWRMRSDQTRIISDGWKRQLMDIRKDTEFLNDFWQQWTASGHRYFFFLSSSFVFSLILWRLKHDLIQTCTFFSLLQNVPLVWWKANHSLAGHVHLVHFVLYNSYFFYCLPNKHGNKKLLERGFVLKAIWSMF